MTRYARNNMLGLSVSRVLRCFSSGTGAFQKGCCAVVSACAARITDKEGRTWHVAIQDIPACEEAGLQGNRRRGSALSVCRACGPVDITRYPTVCVSQRSAPVIPFLHLPVPVPAG